MGRRTVVVKKLSRDCHRQDLKDHFGDLGYIKHIRKSGREAKIVSILPRYRMDWIIRI